MQVGHTCVTSGACTYGPCAAGTIAAAWLWVSWLDRAELCPPWGSQTCPFHPDAQAMLEMLPAPSIQASWLCPLFRGCCARLVPGLGCLHLPPWLREPSRLQGAAVQPWGAGSTGCVGQGGGALTCLCLAEVVHYYLYCSQSLSNPFQQVQPPPMLASRRLGWREPPQGPGRRARVHCLWAEGVTQAGDWSQGVFPAWRGSEWEQSCPGFTCRL